MKNLKMIQAAFVITILSLLVGCSDQFSSPTEAFVPSSNKGVAPEVSEQRDAPLFHTQIRLKPNRSYTFNLANTGLISFSSIDVKQLTSIDNTKETADQCRNINVYTDKISKTNLTCHSNKLNLKEISVQNTSSSMLDFDVVLFGIRPTVKQIDKVND